MLSMQQLSDLIEQARTAPSLDAVWGVLEQLRQGLGYDYFSYAVRFPDDSPTLHLQPHPAIDEMRNGTLVQLDQHPYLFLNNWPDDSLYRYLAQHLVGYDPALRHCWHSPTPLHFEPYWFVQQLHRPPAIAAKVAAVFNSWTEDDVATAFSVGLQGPQGESAALTLSTRSLRGITPASARLNAAVAQGLLPYVHQQVMMLHQWPDTMLPATALTEREQECLRWAAQGKTSWEIGQILHISERTAVAHLTHATAKLGANNRIQAVARAVTQRLI